MSFIPKCETISKDIKTPTYIFNIDLLKERIEIMKSVLGREIDICYAMKANPFVVGKIKDIIDKYEVCSHGEFKICEEAKLPMKKIVLSGVYKEEIDTERIINTYGEEILYTAESINQFLLLDRCAKNIGIKARVILRITTGNQFGIDEAELKKLIENRKEYKGIDIVGIQHFSGTQRKNMKSYKEELDYCDKLIKELREDYSFETKELEFGTGFFFEYFQPKTNELNLSQLETEKLARELDIKLMEDFKDLLDKMEYKGHITLEIGRFIVASCGNYYTKVVDLKKNGDIKFAIMDGGIHQINYFGQMMAMKVPWYRQLKWDGRIYEGGIDKVNICGSLCTVNDNIVKALPLTELEINDILELRNAGAYSMTEPAALFLSRDMPRIYFYEEAKGIDLVRDRIETFQFNY